MRPSVRKLFNKAFLDKIFFSRSHKIPTNLKKKKDMSDDILSRPLKAGLIQQKAYKF